MNLRIPADGTVAPAHAQIDSAQERHLIRPLMGEVKINGKPVQEHWLCDNDVVEVGSYRLRYRTRLSTAGAPPNPPKLQSVESQPRIVNPVSGPPEPALVDTMGGLHRLRAGKTVVGRDAGADIALTWEPTVSRRHVEITVAHGRCTVTDLGSSNGTFVNDVAVSSGVELKLGDELRLGKCVLKMQSDVAAVTVS